MRYKNPYLYDRDTIEHGWATKAEERAYNREYYQKHKEELLRKAREAREGIQRTAQNAYNQARDTAQNAYDTARTEASKFANQYRTSAEQRGTAAKNKFYGTHWKGLKKGMHYVPDSELTNELKRRGCNDRDIQEFFEGRKEIDKFANQRYRQRGTAANEAAKASRNSDPIRNSEAGRFVTNTYNKARNSDAGKFVTDTYNKARRSAKNALDDASRFAEDTYGKARSAAEDVYNKARNTDAGRYLEKTYKNTQTRSQQRKQAKGYKLASDLLAIPDRIANKLYPDRNERNEFYRNNPDAREKINELNRYRRQYGTAANEAAKASMTRAQKEALKKREEAKRRMQKWFKR